MEQNKYILGVDIGGTTCKCGIFDLNLTLLKHFEINTDTSHNGQNIIKNIYTSFTKYFDEPLTDINIAGIGIGVPGPVDHTNEIIRGAINLGWPDWYNVSEEMKKYINTKVVVLNDANAAALGEHTQSNSSHESSVLITLGTGVGGGIVLNNQLITGENGAAGELGHMPVDTMFNFKCNCGLTGCLETVASATGIVNIAKYYYEQNDEKYSSSLYNLIETDQLTAKEVFDAAKQNDELAHHIIDIISLYIAKAISMISVTINPSLVLIGGGVSRAGDILMNRIKKHVESLTFDRAYEELTIEYATLLNQAGIYGAASIIKTSIDS